MNWLSKEDEKKSWRMFRESFWYPARVWLTCISIMYCISFSIVTFPEKNRDRIILEEAWEKFKEIIVFIQSGINFQIAVISMFGTLILTIFINSRNENTWSSPEEYARKSAYRRYVWTIMHFLGSVWFLSFLCKIFNVGIYSDVPAWLFLFLSWFVLSIETHIDKTDVSAHNKVMSPYRKLVKLEAENKYLDKLSTYIYELHTQDAKDAKVWYNRMLKTIVPGNIKGDKLISLVGYSLYIMGGLKKGRIKNFVKQFAILTSQVILSVGIQILSVWQFLRIVYGVELNLNFNAITLWIVAIIYAPLISGYYLVALHGNMINWRISRKIYPQHFKNIMEYLGWIILCYSCLLVVHSLAFAGLAQSIAFSRDIPFYVEPFVFIILFLVMFIFPILEILLYAENKLDKNIENVDCIILNTFQSLYFKSTNTKLELADSSINIYKIAMSVYLRMSSYESYREYMYSLGKSTENIDNDLKDAYEKAKRDLRR